MPWIKTLQTKRGIEAGFYRFKRRSYNEVREKNQKIEHPILIIFDFPCNPF